MQLICLNQNKEHKKDEDETTDTNNFVFNEEYDFHSFTKFDPTIEINFSYFLGVIWNYVKKSYSSIVATKEDA